MIAKILDYINNYPLACVLLLIVISSIIGIVGIINLGSDIEKTEKNIEEME